MNSSRTIAVVCRWLMVFVLLGGAKTSLLLGAVLDQWHWRNPLPQGNALANLIYESGQFIALSELGSVLTSTNGVAWTRRETGLIDNLSDCAFGDGQYVAVGPFGAIATSSDGLTWVPQFGGTFNSLHGVTHGSGMFVAVGDEATILTSDDGVDWTTRAVGPWPLTDVTYAQGLFVAVGRGVVVTSDDGIRWIRRSAADARLLSVSYGGGQFFAVGGDSFEGDGSVWFSTDGISWRSQKITERHSLQALSYGKGVWLAAGGGEGGYFYDGNGGIYASMDTTNWTQVATNVAAITGIAFADSRFVAAGEDGRFLISSNGIDWFDSWQSPFPPVRTSRNMAFVNDSFVAVDGDQFAWSRDGTVWTNNYSVTNAGISFGLSAIAHGHGRYVAGGGYYGTIWTSTNGIEWSNAATNLFGGNVRAIAFGGGRFVAVPGYQGIILDSPDGLTWTLRQLQSTAPPYVYLGDVAYGNGTFVAVGYNNRAASTADGTNWTLSPLVGYFTGIAYGNGVFVVVGEDVTATSSNGVHWTTQAMSESGPLNDVAFGDGWFVAVGGEYEDFIGYDPARPESPILISRDGIHWIRRRSLTSQTLSQVAYGHHTFVIATDRGGFLQSVPMFSLMIEHQSTPRLILSGPLNRSFRIEYADTLAPPVNWQFLSNIVTTTDPFLSFDSQKPGHDGARYYRAVLLP